MAAGVSALPAPAQSPKTATVPRPAPARLQPGQLQPDARLLREVLAQLHPGIYRHVDSVELDRRFTTLIDGPFSQPQTLGDAYRELSLLLASCRDGHTYLNPLNQSKAVRAALFERSTALPFHFRLLPDRQMLVTAGLPAELPKGAEILKIDGHPVTEVVDTLLLATRGDGANDDNRLRRLWLDGSEPVQAFDALYPLFYPVGKTFAIEFRTTDVAPPRSITVAAVKAADREAVLGKLAAVGTTATPLGWKLTFPDSRTARLTLPDFSTWTAPKFDWRKWLAESFATIRHKRIDALILDIRDCEGGDDAVANTLLTYLIKKPVRLPAERQLWRNNHIEPALASMLDTWNPELKKMQPADFRLTSDGWYERADAPTTTPIVAPVAGAFQGSSLYALCGPRNASATFRLLRVLKENKLATLVGQPTGGNRRGTTGGQLFFLRLPNTGLEVDLPLISYQPLRAQPDEGLEPDDVVDHTAATIRKGMDPEMARVTELLRQDRQE